MDSMQYMFIKSAIKKVTANDWIISKLEKCGVRPLLQYYKICLIFPSKNIFVDIITCAGAYAFFRENDHDIKKIGKSINTGTAIPKLFEICFLNDMDVTSKYFTEDDRWL